MSAIPRNRMPVYRIGGDLYLVDPRRERLFRFKGKTRNPRTIAHADAAIHNEALDTVHVDGTTILLQHDIAGIEVRFHAEDWLDTPIAIFDEAEALHAGEVAPLTGGGEASVA